MFRIILVVLFAVTGLVCVAASAAIYFPSGVKPHMNKVFFQPKADAEVDTLVKTAAISPFQEPAIRAFVKRTYMMLGVGIVLAYGTAAGAFGLFFILLSYSIWLSHRIAKIAKAQQGAAANS
jgi:hypothetical protein